MRAFARILKSYNFDVAYSFHRSPRTALMMWLAGIPERVSFSDSYVRLLSTRTVTKRLDRHEVLRNLSLVADDLDEVSCRLSERLAQSTDENVPWADLRVPEVVKENLSARVTALLDGGPFIVLAPGSAWATKQWDSAGFRSVARA